MSYIRNTLVACFLESGERLFIFCQNDPVSFHKIKEGWAFLAAVGQQEENWAPGTGIHSRWCSVLGIDWQEGTAWDCVAWENGKQKTRRALNAPCHEELQDFVRGDSYPDVTAKVQCGNCDCSWRRFLTGPLKSVGFGCLLQRSQVTTICLQNFGLPNHSSVRWDQLLFSPRWTFHMEFITSQILQKYGDAGDQDNFFLLGFLIHFCSIFTAVLILHMWCSAVLGAFRNNF